nr:MAG TPA: hypothetical protein [Bacteriophage sp.]
MQKKTALTRLYIMLPTSMSETYRTKLIFTIKTPQKSTALLFFTYLLIKK